MAGEADGYYAQQAQGPGQSQYPPPAGQQHPQQYPQQYLQQYPAPVQQSPPYQEQNKPNQGNAEQGYGAQKQDFTQQFKVDKPRYHDIWAAVLFLAVCAGFVVVSGIAIQGYAATKGFNGGGIYGSSNTFSLDTNTIVLFAFCLAVSVVLSLAYMGLARTFTKQFIWITGILNIIFGLVTAIYMLSRRYWSGGIVFLVFSVFTIICFVSWIPRIPFSVVMLQTSIDVSRRHGHVYIVSMLGGLLATAFGAWFAVTLAAVYVKYEPGANPACNQGIGSCSTAKVIGLIVFITFAAYWITEFLKNVIHTIISGVYGSWYFCGGANLPKGITRGATRRALTYSFGSISLGSLVVALINMMRQACSIARSGAAADGNIVADILFCLLGCLIGILDWAVQFINRYAFSYVALYGKSYLTAAKNTWNMMKDRGVSALVNECLIGPVFTMGATFVAYACALLAYLYLVFTDPAYNRGGEFTPVIVAFAFLIGLQICQIFTTPINSGTDAIFVAMAFDPQALESQHPELFQKMLQTNPDVQRIVQHVA